MLYDLLYGHVQVSQVLLLRLLNAWYDIHARLATSAGNLPFIGALRRPLVEETFLSFRMVGLVATLIASVGVAHICRLRAI